jgi:hypothetical protein
MRRILANFTPWHPWARRKDGSINLGLPGVYLLAEFDRRPTLGTPALSRKIFYIGETCSTLHRRLYSFQRSAFENKFGHSGGATFFKVRKSKPDLDRVYVSAMPVDRPEVEREAFIRYAERALLWFYYERHGVMPACNRK